MAANTASTARTPGARSPASSCSTTASTATTRPARGPARGGSNVVGPDCAERAREGRTLLGAAQERWLDGALAGSKSRWNLLAQQTLMAPAGRPTGKGMQYWTDGWDGYPRGARAAPRNRSRRAAPPIPWCWAATCTPTTSPTCTRAPDDAGLARASPRSSAGPPSSSQGAGSRSSWPSIRDANPHIRYADGSRRGYVMLDVGRERLEARLRVLDTVARTDAGVSTAATLHGPRRPARHREGLAQMKNAAGCRGVRPGRRTRARTRIT